MISFKLTIADFDTALFRSAKYVQEEYITVTRNGITKEFKNRTEFYGHHSKKADGWLKDTNTFLGTDGQFEDDFVIEDHVRLCPTIE